MKISINIPFWYSNQDRLDNLELSYKCLVNLQKYLIEKGLNVSINVFEFSKDRQYFTNSIFSPIGGNYNKSFKLNIALKYLKENDSPDIVSFFDSDCFVDLVDYDKVYEQLVNFDKLKYYCNNLTKLDKKEYLKDNLEVNKSFYSYHNSGIINGLGGVWICDFNTLYEIGGFDERYIGWGKEDEDVGKRFWMKGLSFEQLNFKAYHLPHKVEFSKGNLELRKIQDNIYLNDNTIIRATLLNNYQC